MSARRWGALTAVELDTLVIAALTDTLRTEVSSESARALGREAAHELQSLLVFAPRLWGFEHRHSLSLRHPRTSFETWAHRIRGGAPSQQAYDLSEIAAPPHVLLQDASAAGQKWEKVASVYQLLLDNCPEVDEARLRVVTHAAVRDAISRTWRRLVDETDSSRGETNCGTMRPMQYMYFEIRLAQTLLPDNLLATVDLLEIFEWDMLVDLHRPTAGEGDWCAAAFDAQALDDMRRRYADGELQTNPSASNEVRTATGIDNAFGAAYQEHIWPVQQRLRDYRGLPNMTFEQFSRSMLELADNWTSTSNPLEYAAFLFDVYEKIFTHDWCAQADALLISAAVKRKAPGSSGGVPVYSSKAGMTTATAAQRKAHRRESSINGFNDEIVGSATRSDMTMGQIMLLPPDVREGLLDGTAAEIVDMDVVEAEIAEKVRSSVPIVAVKYVPQFILRGETRDGDRVYHRGNRVFRTTPRMLFTITTEPDSLRDAVAESRAAVPQNDTSRRKPHVKQNWEALQ